jgi:tight adherence protein B
VLTVLLFAGTFLLLTLIGVEMLFLRLLIAFAAAAGPTAYIFRARGRRLKKFEENLPDAIDLFTRTMRAGHNIHSGLETIATETLDPVRQEFKKMMEELALGSQVEPALHNLGRRVPLIDLKFFITGLILQRQTGANMVAVLEGLASLVRERLNMAAKLKAHTAQQRFSAGLLCLMPIVVGLGFWILKPEYIKLLYTDPVGSKFLTYAIISEIVGILVIRRIANIRA